MTRMDRRPMSETHPQLAAEFHPKKNGDLTPENLTAGTGKRIVWICKSCKHDWVSTGQNRKKGQGCPACSGRVVHKNGKNSMRNTHPELAKEFHPELNGDLSPDNTLAGTGKKITWICNAVSEAPCGHIWKASGATRMKHGCPSCKGQAIHRDGRNSMRRTHPELSEEFHTEMNGDISPDNIMAGYSKNVKWLCKVCSHIWEATPTDRKNGNGCPCCAGKAIHIDGRNSLRTVHPELSEEFHPTRNGEDSPDNLVAGTNKRIWWLCSVCSHEWATSCKNRTSNGSGCGACKNKVIHIDGRNSMRNTHPELAAELHPDLNGDHSPDNLLAGTHKRLTWICRECSHIWVAAGQNRAKSTNPSGCPACSSQALHIDGRNSMRNTHPHLAERFHPTKNGDMSPDNLFAGTMKKLWWLCLDCGNEWKSSGNKQSYAPASGCPSCNRGDLRSDGKNSMRATHPELAAEFHPELNGKMNPDNIVAGSYKKIVWKCGDCDHIWRATGANRKSGYGCGACAGQVLHSEGKNSMRRTHPKLAAEFHPSKNGKFTPDNVMAGTHRRFWWVCKEVSDNPCGHTWSSVSSSRVVGHGCPACSDQELHSEGKNSLQSRFPELAIEFHGTLNGNLTAETVLGGGKTKYWWECSHISPTPCGFTWSASIQKRKHGRGCPACSKTGFDPSKPGFYYVNVIMNSSGDVIEYKGGITNNDPEIRFERQKSTLEFSYNGLRLEMLDRHYFPSGQDAANLEVSLKRISEIRSPPRELMDGGSELFVVNPLDYARNEGILV